MSPLFRILSSWLQGAVSVALLIGATYGLFQEENQLTYRILIFLLAICFVCIWNYFFLAVIDKASKQPTSIVYMPLEKEGTECFRPVVAHRLIGSRWKIDSTLSVPETEEWKFQPNEEIEIKNRVIGGIRTPIASGITEHSANQSR